MGRQKKPSNMTLSELIEEQKKLTEDLRILKQEKRVTEYRIAKLTKNEMTHRLCDHGRLLERYFPPDDFTDEQIDMILFGLLRNPKNEKAVDILKAGGHVSW